MQRPPSAARSSLEGRAGRAAEAAPLAAAAGASRAVEAELRRAPARRVRPTRCPSFDVMAALERQPAGMTMTRALALSDGLQRQRHRHHRRLVAEGLVVRLADEQDRRATFVRLTRQGRAPFAAMAKAHETWVSEMLAAFRQSSESSKHHRAAEPIGRVRTGRLAARLRAAGGTPMFARLFAREHDFEPVAERRSAPEGCGRARSHGSRRHLHARQPARRPSSGPTCCSIGRSSSIRIISTPPSSSPIAWSRRASATTPR